MNYGSEKGHNSMLMDVVVNELIFQPPFYPARVALRCLEGVDKRGNPLYCIFILEKGANNA
jgi:hypothetical protein